MLVAPALALGVKLEVLALPDGQGTASIGTIREFASGCDVLTFGNGSISSGLIRALEAEGVRVRPTYETTALAKELAVAEASAGDSELSVLVARSPHGQAGVWAVTTTVSRGSLGEETITPAPNLTAQVVSDAQRLALEAAGSVKLVGVMNVWMQVVDGQVSVARVALGPQPAGDWTIEAAATSQFEQHLRAILDLPLGSTELLAQAAVTCDIVGTDKTDLYRPYLHVFARDPGVKVHQYGQDPIPGKKLGHVTVIGSSASDLHQRAAHAADYISGVIDE